MELHPIATIQSPFPEKFGVPRQSGLIGSLQAWVIFQPAYRAREAFRGIEGFSHLWLIWQFDRAKGWSPTVRPPRLGGNPLGLSCVELEKVDYTGPDAPRLLVRGADLVDGTPIFDVKPYLPTADCHPAATGGFTDTNPWQPLTVDFPPDLLAQVPPQHPQAHTAVQAARPPPPNHPAPLRVYGMRFAHLEVKFTVSAHLLTVLSVTPA